VRKSISIVDRVMGKLLHMHCSLERVKVYTNLFLVYSMTSISHITYLSSKIGYLTTLSVSRLYSGNNKMINECAADDGMRILRGN
jgi:aspartate ammonia-lyase